MYRSLIFIIFTVLTLTSCSNKYIGMNSPEIWDGVCSIEEEVCAYTMEDFEIDYILTSTVEGQYKLEGNAIWVNHGMSKIYDKIASMKLTIVFLDDHKVIQQEGVFLNGERDKPLTFSTEFLSSALIKHSRPVEYRYRITE